MYSVILILMDIIMVALVIVLFRVVFFSNKEYKSIALRLQCTDLLEKMYTANLTGNLEESRMALDELFEGLILLKNSKRRKDRVVANTVLKNLKSFGYISG